MLAALLSLTTVTTSMAMGPYFGAALGGSFYHDSDCGASKIKYDTGIAATGSLGYDFDGFRIEGEFGYRNAEVNNFLGFAVADGQMDTSIYSYMANAYWDINTGTTVTPFVGGGIGLLHGRMTDPNFTYNDDVVGYQLSVGAGIRVSKHIKLDVVYKYQAAVSDFHVGLFDVSYDSSNFLAGMRYEF